MYTINQFTENHILSTMMIVDLIYFPLYIFERIVAVEFTITTPSSFIINSIAGFINFFLMLIYNEILELKFWGLNTNLSININARQKTERIDEDTDNNSSDKRYSITTVNSVNEEDEKSSSRKTENIQ